MGLFPDLSGVEARLTRLEAKLDRVLVHLGLEQEETDFTDVRALVASGNKIEAIKRYRELTGLGLKASKEAVEAFEIPKSG